MKIFNSLGSKVDTILLIQTENNRFTGQLIKHSRLLGNPKELCQSTPFIMNDRQLLNHQNENLEISNDLEVLSH